MTVLTDNGLLYEMMQEVTQVNKDNGWHEDGRTMGDEVALLHSEVSEMLEEFRDHRLVTVFEYNSKKPDVFIDERPEIDGVLGKPIGLPSEAADVLVRLLDTCDRYDIDLFHEWRQKVDFNKTRGHKHGNKAL